MKTAELDGVLLDYWTARANGLTDEQAKFVLEAHSYSTEWAHGGPIIERERIGVTFGAAGEVWHAMALRAGILSIKWHLTGPTPLIAAMRVFIALKFGDTVPDEPRAG